MELPYVYGDAPAAPSARSNRRTALRKALDELEQQLNWIVYEKSKDMYRIVRPRRVALVET